MGYKIIVDSSADLPDSIIEKYDIGVIPLKIHFGDKTYLDKVDLSSSEFYNKLVNSEVMPSTSQITPDRFEKVFREELDKGNDIICVTIGSKASGTCQSANIAKNEIGSDRVHVIDSEMLCMGTGMLAIKIAKMVEKNMTIEQITEECDKLKYKIEQLFCADTLKYLKKGGRIKASTAVIAEILNIKPILNVEYAITQPISKVRGKKRVFSYFINHIKETIDLEKNDFISVAYSEDLASANKLIDLIRNELNYDKEIILTEVGATIGTHSGPGVLAVFYIKK